MTTLEILKDYVNTDKWKWSEPQIGRDNCIEIIDALKKQVPMKVVREHKKYKRHYTDKFFCPSCGCSALTDTGDSFVDYGLNYCDTCGQKLDWSD